MDNSLFKGKRVDNNEWITGCLIKNIFFKKNTNESIYYILNVDNIEYDCFDDLNEFNGFYEVIPYTVEQINK